MTKVDACECMDAVARFAAVIEDFVGDVEGRSAVLESMGGPQVERADLLQEVYSALTKAEKSCGHIKAHDVRNVLEDLRTDIADHDPEEAFDLSDEGSKGEFHDYMTTQLVLDLARGMEEKR